MPVPALFQAGSWEEISHSGGYLYYIGKITPNGTEKSDSKRKCLISSSSRNLRNPISHRSVKSLLSKLTNEQKYVVPTRGGVPSLSTMSRVLTAVDGELVSLALINWIGEISNTRRIHIAIDGKGLRAESIK